MSLILIVDDAQPLAEQYAYDLKRLGGHDTLMAPEGKTALDTIAREPVDCVLLDLEMPGMDGFEVLRQLAHRGLRVPVIVYTGTGNYDRCAQAIRLGAVSFIDKAEPMERVLQEPFVASLLLVSTGLLALLYIPPPGLVVPVVRLPSKVTSVRVGLEKKTVIPPPYHTELLALNVTRSNVKLDAS